MDDRIQNQEEELAAQFIDPEYRRAWAEDYLDTALALQISTLRAQRHWNQAELARRAGTAQSAVSRMEDVEYGAHSIRVLKQLADAFGLRLQVSFEEFGDLIRESREFSEEGLKRRSFEQDPYITELLAARGLSVPQPAPSPEESAHPEDEVEGDPEPVEAKQPATFEEEFAEAMAAPLPDRVGKVRRWLMGYGLPSQDEPVYKRIYYAIPADGSHAEVGVRLAEACAELLLPESFGDLMSDPDDGELALTNLLRVSAMLPAGRPLVIESCRILFPWLGAEWPRLDGVVQDAVIDLAVELNESELADLIVDWQVNDRQVLRLYPYLGAKVSHKLFDALAASLERESIRDRKAPLITEASEAIIRTNPNQLEVIDDLNRPAVELPDIAATRFSMRDNLTVN